MRRRFRTIRARLLVGFVLMALLSTLGISVSAIIVGYINGREQAFDQLEAVLALKALQLDVWAAALHNDLTVALNDQYANERVDVVLNLANQHRYYSYYNAAMQRRLTRLVEQSPYLEHIWLLDRHGRIVLSTHPNQNSGMCERTRLFQEGIQRQTTAFLFPADACAIQPADGTFISIAARPVWNTDDALVGIIAGSAEPHLLHELLNDRTGAGTTGTISLLTRAGGLLTTGNCDLFADDGMGLLLNAVTAINPRHSEVRENACGQPIVGVYRWLPSFGVLVAAEQTQSEAFNAIFTNLSISSSIALIAVLLAVVAAVVITRSITEPLVTLADTASQIAGGKLNQIAPIHRNDEVGTLAAAFNSMTGQLRGLIADLDRQVAARTQTLERRALQLETSARVSREITSILDIDPLLERVADLIRDAFGYYHVLIFLRDGDALVLRANTAGINRDPALALPMDIISLNTEAARMGVPVVVGDVTREPRYRASTTLTDTRAELVIPLKVGDELIGTLDVHSTAHHAFTPEDVLVNQSLGDQIAIAIHNARLYDRSRDLAVREERNRLARDLHDSVIQSLYSLSLLSEGWRRSTESDAHLERVSEISRQALKEMRLLVYELRPLGLQHDGLLGALHQRLEAVERRAGIETRLRADDVYELPAAIEEGLYWIAQEALNNALKHAGASQIAVRLDSTDTNIVLTISDDGAGFEPCNVNYGMGLQNMTERAQRLGGTVQIASAPGAGTTIMVAIPYCDEQAAAKGKG